MTALAGRRRSRAAPVRVPAVVVAAAAVVLAALSLLLPWALAFDPSAWLVWGRQLTHGTLDTSAGPSWKPGPVIVTTPLSLLGSTAAPVAWLLVARTGALLAVAGTAALADRIAGRWAGIAAAVVVLLSEWWAYNGLLGNSEGWLAAAACWSVACALTGRTRGALAWGVVAALLRPEAWPFLGVYGLYRFLRASSERTGVVAAAVVVLLAWFGPDVLGAGGALGASDAARGPASAGSAALADQPVLAVLGDFATLLTMPALVLAAVALVVAPRGRSGAAAADVLERAGSGRAVPPRPEWIVAALALAWVAIVAVMTAAGYAGNPRYLVAATAVGAAVAGAGAVRLAPRLPVLVVLVLLVAVGATTASELNDQRHDVADRADRRAALDTLVATAGGRGAVLACAPVRTATRQRSWVAWRLDVPVGPLDDAPRAPAVLLRARGYGPTAAARGFEPARDPALDGLSPGPTAPGWQLWRACR